MTLEAMTTLVAESEAMDIINASLKPDQHKLPPSKGKPKEEAMTTVETPLKKKKAEEKEKPRRKLPDEAYQMGCWVCGGQHRRDSCDTEKSKMLCKLCGKENNLVTAVCLQKFADSSPAGQPVGKPATPGIQSGMVVVETKKPSYAQVAAAIVVNSTSGLSSPPPSPRKLPLPLPGGSKLSSTQGHRPGGGLGRSVSTLEASASGGPGRSVNTHDASAEKALTAARPASG